MRNLISLGMSLLLCVLLGSFAYGSGSLSGGAGINQASQMYVQGKMVFFKKIACDSGCPLTRGSVSKQTAQDVLASIRSKDALKANRSNIDNAVASLSSDESEQISQYLSRRFNLS